MNLAQAMDTAVIADARKPKLTPGPTLAAAKESGAVTVRTHRARYEDEEPHLGGVRAGAGRPIGTRRRTSNVQALMNAVVAAITEAGKPLRRGELATRLRIDDKKLAHPLSQLMEGGRLTLIGRSRHYRYCLAETGGTGLEPPAIAPEPTLDGGKRDPRPVTRGVTLRELSTEELAEFVLQYPWASEFLE